MASTNKTTNYELSQYVGSDKPSYLNDYNQDMSRIDSGIHAAKSEADTNATAIGTLSSLTTTAKTNLVAAINEVDSEASTANSTAVQADGKADTNATAIGTLANLDTTAKTDLVSAINEVNGKTVTNAGDISDLESALQNFNLTTFTTINASDMTITGGSVNPNAKLTIATNSDGSLFKLYGNLTVTNTSSNDIVISFSSSLRPTTAFDINPCGIMLSASSTYKYPRWGNINVATNGTITITFAPLESYTGNVVLTIYPCLYYAKDFGDTPSN